MSDNQQLDVLIAVYLIPDLARQDFDAYTKLAGDGEIVTDGVALVVPLVTMRLLAEEGMTMLVVTHEMGFARQVANRIVFMDEGQIVEINAPDPFFNNPQHERTKLFLSQIL